MHKVDSLILGYGYTTRFLEPLLRAQNFGGTVGITSRSKKDFIIFDLDRPSTWDNLPSSEFTYWTFPPSPTDRVIEFIKKKKSQLGRLVVVGSTSAFTCYKADEEIDEFSNFNLSLDRARAESFLKNSGAILVMSSGIYGPNRNPVDWIKKNYVGKSKKFVNMIHIEDLCLFLYKGGNSR